MKRRDFLEGWKGLAALALLGGTTSDTWAGTSPPEPIGEIKPDTIKPFEKFNGQRLMERVKYWTENPKDDKYPLLYERRMPIVSYTPKNESKIDHKVRGNIFMADVIADDQEASIQDTVGRFEFVPNSIPSLKIGSRLSESTLIRIYEQSIKPTEKSEKFLDKWFDNLAENLAIGLRQRRNQLSVMYMLGASDFNNYGVVVRLDLGIPEGVHSTVESATFKNKPLSVIRKHLRFIKRFYGATYDRMTLSSEALQDIVSTQENKRLNKTVGNTDHAVKELSKTLKLDVELDDSTFLQRSLGGETKEVRYLPANEILFSSKKNDNNPEICHFASTVCTESIVSSIFDDGKIKGGAQHGPIAYFTGNRDLNPPDIRAWAVTRGLPVIKDLTAFSSITTKEK
jgi:hypothetical protein